MNESALSTPMQVLLVWTLLGLLLTWLLVFTVLALRSSAREKANTKDLPTPSRSFPAISAPAALHVITSSPGGVVLPIAAAASVEASSDAGYSQRET
jgi:hypothetical protein